MRIRRIFEITALIGLQAVLAGCAASHKMVALQPLETDLRPYSSIVLSVESNVAEDVQKEMSDLESLAVSKVKALNIFQSVLLGDGTEAQPGTLLIKASISNIKKVSGTTRFMLGAFAGRASMTTDIVFIDAVAQKEIGSYSITGQSGGTGISGGTSDAVKKAAEGIADLLVKNYKQ